MEHSIVGFFVNKRSTSAPLASCRHIVTFQVWPLLPYYYKTFQANWSHLLASLLCDNSQFLCNWLEVSPSCKWDWKVSTIAETIPPLTTRHWSRQYRLACLHAAALQSCADHIWRCYGDFASYTHSNSFSTSSSVSNTRGIMSLSPPLFLCLNPQTVLPSLCLQTRLSTPYYLLFSSAVPHSCAFLLAFIWPLLKTAPSLAVLLYFWSQKPAPEIDILSHSTGSMVTKTRSLTEGNMAWSERETDRNWMFTSRFVPLSLTVNLNSFTRYQKLQCTFMTTADASGRKSYGGCVSWVWIFQLCTTVFIKSQAASHIADKNQCFMFPSCTKGYALSFLA